MLKSNSIYTVKLDDPKAVYLTSEEFDVYADGIHDDTLGIQQAINKVQETVKYGILFIPEGNYLLTDTLYVWKGIRLIGYGTNRPTFVLGEHTPGYSEEHHKYMIHFASDKPKEGQPFRDANPGTFYSALNNINIEIKKGNTSAVGVRSHFAQHCFLSNIDFYIGEGVAGVSQVGNEMENCRFFSGQYGIITTKPSPSWPFLLIDSYFEGQRVSCIRTEEGGLTLVRNHFKNAPCAISINPERAEELWLTDSIFENISERALVISDEHNARTQINIKNLDCIHVPTLAYFRSSEKIITSPSNIYKVVDFCHGNQIDELDAIPEIKTTYEIEQLDQFPQKVASDIPSLPPCETWVNLLTLGAKGDGVTDDTQAILDAFEHYSVIYFPTGRYRVTDTITLKSDTVFIGLNPISSQILIEDRSPEFNCEGGPKPLLVTPKGGTNIVTGIGLDTGGINKRALACKWMAGSQSYMNDVKFVGGHGTYYPDGTPVPVYNNNRLGDGNKDRQWDSQYPSLWITENGGGTFKDIWTASPYAQAGLYISNTNNEGRIYAMSTEHHVRYEVKLENVSNFKFYDLQMEEELGEGFNCLPLSIENCENLLFANLYLYRTIFTRSPYPHAVKVKDSHNIEFRGVHVYSPSKYTFGHTLYDETNQFNIRSREIARLNISGKKIKIQNKHHLEKVVSGFEFIDGLTSDKQGNVYFVDSRWHMIYRYSPKTNELKLICDTPISPLCLTFDDSNHLLVATKTGTVYSMDPNDSLNTMQALIETNEKGNQAVYPGHRWRDEHNFLDVVVEDSHVYFNSLDKSIYIPKSWDLSRAHSLRKANVNQPFYVADEFGQKTYSFEVNPDGTLKNTTLFAEEGEFDVAVDVNENVYIAAGYIFVFDKTGKKVDQIEVPERPTCIVFGDEDMKTLYITAGTSLYKYRID